MFFQQKLSDREHHWLKFSYYFDICPYYGCIYSNIISTFILVSNQPINSFLTSQLILKIKKIKEKTICLGPCSKINGWMKMFYWYLSCAETTLEWAIPAISIYTKFFLMTHKVKWIAKQIRIIRLAFMSQQDIFNHISLFSPTQCILPLS